MTGADALLPARALPLVVIRPQPGNDATCTAARARGAEALGYPLFTVEPLAWDVPCGPFDAILAGSANVFRHGGAGLGGLAGTPVIAVGEATAMAARAAGFTVSGTGTGGLQPVVNTLPPGRYIRIAGENRVDLAPPNGVRITTVIAYAARPSPFPGALAHILESGSVVLLHSGEAAQHFAAETERLDLKREYIHLACLAPRIAARAGSGWGGIRTAPERTDAMLLETGLRMCQTV